MLLVSPASAQFGVANKHPSNHVKQQQQASGGITEIASVDAASGDVLQGIMDDPELREAVEMLSEMSPEEMEETLGELAEMLGSEDPETAEALREAMKEVSEMSPGEMRNSLGQIVGAEYGDVDISDEVSDTLRMLKEADDDMIETILARKDHILETVIQSGQISQEDAERYRKHPFEWEKELKGIWGELQRQAAGDSL